MGSSIFAFAFDSRSGKLTQEQAVSTLPPDFLGHNHAAEIQIDDSGQFLYASNRGHDSIAVFQIDLASGRLARVDDAPSGREIPVHFAIDPSGRWLLTANQGSNNISVLRRDPKTGLLTGSGRQIAISRPQCILFARQ
jgi:6-phosphogluconolactonase